MVDRLDLASLLLPHESLRQSAGSLAALGAEPLLMAKLDERLRSDRACRRSRLRASSSSSRSTGNQLWSSRWPNGAGSWSSRLRSLRSGRGLGLENRREHLDVLVFTGKASRELDLVADQSALRYLADVHRGPKHAAGATMMS